MASAGIFNQAGRQEWSDEQIVDRVLSGETALYEILMRRYNQRLYRVARAILRDDAEAEDVMQDAYVRAYQHLADFEGRAKFSTWLTRIAVHEALARSRGRGRFQPLEASDVPSRDVMNKLESTTPSPERSAYDRELGRVLEDAILSLPEPYRVVFTMRDVEEMSIAETAERREREDSASSCPCSVEEGTVRTSRGEYCSLSSVSCGTLRPSCSRGFWTNRQHLCTLEGTFVNSRGNPA